MKDILNFLKGLQNNNSREWMEENKAQYLIAKQKFEDIISLLIDRIITFDPFITGAEPKKCIFRLNRDIRFSKDKRPYKENMGGFINRNGRKGMDGGYYLHIQPGKCMLAGGIYMPPPEILKKIRQEIDYNPGALIKYMNSREFKDYFGSFEGDRLKKAPQGYSPDHPNIELLKLKYYTVFHMVKDKDVLGPGFIEYASRVFKAMYPLNAYLRATLED